MDNTCIVFCMVPFCTSCSSFGYCQTCQEGLKLSTFGDLCLTCNVLNCLTCEQTNIC